MEGFFFNDTLYCVFQRGNIRNNGFPKLSRPYLVIPVHEHMAHPLNVVPLNLPVSVAKSLREHIYSFAYYFYMFDEPEIGDWIGLRLFKCVLAGIIRKYIGGVKDMAKPFDISNLFSHK